MCPKPIPIGDTAPIPIPPTLAEAAAPPRPATALAEEAGMTPTPMAGANSITEL